MGMTANLSENPRALIEEQWSAACPECGQQLSANDQREHLLSAHGYIDLAGIVLPPVAALTCLWDRVFTTGDVQAHDRLCQLLVTGAEPEPGRPSYVVALEAELLRHADALLSSKHTELLRLVRCLKQNEAAR